MVEMTNVDIETLVLAAVWKCPFIFQGYFNIAEKSSLNYQLLLFRCKKSVYLLAMFSKRFAESYSSVATGAFMVQVEAH
ncbi:MAG: hypothetical protein Q8R24_08570 [Legionellaceae bacterium]|nr:hypothetical protein [Legionellaceae bacterium]